ncbi:MAG: hypothetical protein JWM11_3498 [Planctomycetaceae bacterium]|nr:hypothetical protein [Planctomycetaceae bacterium]
MPDRMTRRQFTGSVATGSTLAAVIAGHADEPAKKNETNPVSDKAKTEEVRSTTELITQIAKQEFPHEKLDEAAVEEIRSDVRANLGRSKVLSAFPLANSDEPGFVFSAWRKDPV